MKGILLRRLAGSNQNDKTGLLVRALDKISILFDSKKPEHWEAGLNNLNKMLPYALSKESYEHPLLALNTKTGENGNAQVFIQLNQFMDDRETRKNEINEETASFKEIPEKEVKNG